jgi:hypothetical protein
MRNALRAGALLWLPALALAHPGHGLAAPSHWHASDTFGLLVVIALTALAWAGTGKK